MSLLGLSFGDDYFVGKEEDDHGNATLENHSTDVIYKGGHNQPGHHRLDAVDGVDDAVDNDT